MSQALKCHTMYRSKQNIRKDAYLLRKKLGLTDELYFPILEFVENVLPQLYPDPKEYSFEVVESKELKGRFAETDPFTGTIRVRQDVYDAAFKGNYKARMVLAHEVGHYLYLKPENIQYAKLDSDERIPKNIDPEWQADYFAASLMIPHNLTKGMNYHDIASKCGVSFAAATYHIKERNKIARRQWNKRRSAAKQKAQLPRS